MTTSAAGAAPLAPWQVLFYDNVPVWQYGTLITAQPAPNGASVPCLYCASVQLVQNGFIELTLHQGGTNPELTLLVPAMHVMSAIRMRQVPQTGFSPPPAATLVQDWTKRGDDQQQSSQGIAGCS